MEIFHLKQTGSTYPFSLKKYLGRHAPAVITGLGNVDVLNHRKLAFFCSVKCPGHLILKAHDFVKGLAEAIHELPLQEKITVIGGFHSPIERECLTILLRGEQPVIVCPARSIKGMRMRGEYKKPLEEGRLLFLSPFKESQRRNTVETAIERNRFVAALADAVFVAHASPNSKMEKFCREVLTWGKGLYTFESESNSNLIQLGAKPMDSKAIRTMIGDGFLF